MNNIQFDIVRKDDDERKVWGIFSMSTKNGKLLVDLHGDAMEPSVLQKSAHKFVLFSRMAGDSHKEMGVGHLIESIVLTKEIAEVMQESLKAVGVEDPVIQPNAEFWFGAFYIEKESTWKMIKDGDFGAFSIGGFSRKEEVDIQE